MGKLLKMIQCPYHPDSNPSMAIYSDGWAHCFGCGVHVRAERVGFELEMLPKKQPQPTHRLFPDSEDGLMRVWRVAEASIMSARGYLEKRSLIPALQFMSFGFLQNRLIIPFRRPDGSIFGLTGRAINDTLRPKYYSSKLFDSLPFVPSWALLKNSHKIYLFFGVITAIAGAIAGLPSVGSPTGKNMKPHLLDFWGGFIDIVPDKGEEENAIALRDSLIRSWRVRVVEVAWPEGTKDFDELRLLVGCERAVHFLE